MKRRNENRLNTINHYDSDGNLTKITYHNSNGELVHTSKVEYGDTKVAKFINQATGPYAEVSIAASMVTLGGILFITLIRL